MQTEDLSVFAAKQGAQVARDLLHAPFAHEAARQRAKAARIAQMEEVGRAYLRDGTLTQDGFDKFMKAFHAALKAQLDAPNSVIEVSTRGDD